MEAKLRILQLEDEMADAELVSALLRDAGLPVEIDRVEDRATFKEFLQRGGYTLILSDFTTPAIEALEALRWARQRRPEIPFIFVSAGRGEEAAIEALKDGATDYVLKNRLDRLVPAVRRALEEAEEHARRKPDFMDITERKNSEEALRETEQRYRSLFQNVNEGFCIVQVLFDPNQKPIDYIFLETNPSFDEQTGLTGARGKRMRELLPKHEEPWLETYGQVALTGQPARFQTRAEQLSRWFDVYAFRLGRSEQRQVAVRFQDITEQKQAAEALSNSEARLRLAIETAELGMYERDFSTNAIRMNEACERILGVASETVPLDIAHRSVHPADKDRVLAAVARAFDPTLREICAAEFRILRPDTTVRWVAGRGRVVFDDTASPPRGCKFLGVLNDITERKLAEEQSVLAKDELSRVNAQLEQRVAERTAKLAETVAELEHFSYTITHDMRAPLRAMRGLSGLLLEEDDHPQQREYLRRITDSAERMDKLITDALQFSGVVRQQFELEEVDADVLLRGILDSYPQFQPPRAHIQIVNRLGTILGNQAAMTQCFSNLLGNAIKFVQPGTVPEIRVWSEARGEYVRLWFEDKGIGIEKEYHHKIWEMFQRLSKQYEGTGIGLALVRKTVERMGGTVGLESQPGHGSRFWIELKRAPAPKKQSATDKSE